MRRAYHQEIVSENGVFLGIDLGSDYVSEHECGVENISKAFQVDTSLPGIDGLTIQQTPRSLTFREIMVNGKEHFLLILMQDTFDCFDVLDKNAPEKYLPWFELNSCSGEDIQSSWDESSFGLLVSKKYESEIKDLYAAIQRNDVAIGLNADEGYRNNGLLFLIVSKLSNEDKNTILESDLEG